MRTHPPRLTLAFTLLVVTPVPAYAWQTPPATKAEASKAPPTLKEGASGEAVEALQRLLNARLTTPPRLDVDGDFGPDTRNAVLRFQKAKGLTETGAVDRKTWDALGTPPPAETDAPSPEAVNATPAPKLPPDRLDGPPFVSVKAWAVVDGPTGALLGGKDADKPLDNASTTKMMTALVVSRFAKAHPGALDETITFSDRADKTVGSTSGVKAGESLPVRELLYGLLLPSGNDASVALAEHFARRLPAVAEEGPTARFLAAMNRKAAALGLLETHFANPHGLPDPAHRSSARDLARLGAVAMQEPTFAAVVATRQRGATLVDREGKSRDVVWTNTNRLLDIEGYDGVKTGTTSGAGSCLVASGRRGDDALIVVVLGAPTSAARDADARNLFRWAWKNRH